MFFTFGFDSLLLSVTHECAPLMEHRSCLSLPPPANTRSPRSYSPPERPFLSATKTAHLSSLLFSSLLFWKRDVYRFCKFDGLTDGWIDSYKLYNQLAAFLSFYLISLENNVLYFFSILLLSSFRDRLVR